ncbi:hypothetical protein LTR28_005942, partial [Elasticomyces elasticus]
NPQNVTPSLHQQSDHLLFSRTSKRDLALRTHSTDIVPSSTEKVLIITVDGRTLVGTLLSCDQVTNVLLEHAVERVIREHGSEQASEEQPLGSYLIRGDNVVVCGLVDEALDASIDWTKVRGDVIGSTKNI